MAAPLVLFLVKTFERQCLSVDKVRVSCEVSVAKPAKLSLYYTDSDEWQPDHRVEAMAPGGDEPSTVRFPVIRSRNISGLRIVPDSVNDRISIGQINLSAPGTTTGLDMDTTTMTLNDLDPVLGSMNDAHTFQRTGIFPFLEFEKGFVTIRTHRYTLADKLALGGFLLVCVGTFLWLWYRSQPPAWAGTVQLDHAVFAILFSGALSAQFYFGPSGISEVDPYLERRSLKPFPTDTTEKFTAGLDDWLVDRFAVRQQLTRLKSLMDYYWFDKSSKPGIVILGRNKEMYPSSFFLLDDYMGKITLSEAQLFSIQRNITERILYMKALGKDYYLMFTPSKQTIYPEDLPVRYRNHHQPERTMVSQVVNYLEKDTLVAQYICDTRPELERQAAISDNRLYFGNDIHWNELGAYIGYRQLIEKIAVRYPSIKPLDRSEFDVIESTDDRGDQARSLMIQREVPRTLFEFKRKHGPAYTLVFEPSAKPFMFCHTTFPDSTLPTALVFRDSFSEALIPFLAYNFSDAYFVWDPTFDVDLIAKRKPDLVIQELTEMFIYALLTVNPKSMQSHG